MRKIAINGFGRIGRAAFKIAMERKDVEVVAINDLSEPETMAYLLSFDSVFGRYDKHVEVEKDKMLIDGKEIKLFQEMDPKNLPWEKLGVEVVLECTGVFLTQEKAQGHLDAGAKKVILSAPPKDDTPIFCIGCNTEKYNPKKDHIVSNASCTTNCLAPVAKVLNREIGIDKALMTTIHSYTSTQGLVDGPNKKDPRRGRAAALNISPATTGAAIAVTKVFPELEGKFDGMAFRVPSPNVSIIDLVVKFRQNVTIEKINSFLINSAKGELRGVLDTENRPLVSTDFVGNKHSSIVDLEQTMVIGNDMGKIVAWYDNEWGYSERLIDLAVFVLE